MTNNNNNNIIPIEVNKKPFETVQEVENKIPSYEEFMKSYGNDDNLNYDDLSGGEVGENKGYGPCRNTLCGCSCSSERCICKGTDKSIYRERDHKIGNFTAKGREVDWKDVSGDTSVSLFRGHQDGLSDTKFVSGSAGITAGRDNTLEVRLGLNLLEHKSEGVGLKLGINVDTGGSVNSDGVKANLLGCGFSVGKKNSINTPIFSVSKDADDCVIQ